MEFKLVNSSVNHDVLVVPCFENEDNKEFDFLLKELSSKNIFSCKKCTSYRYDKFENGKFLNVMFLGLGKKDNLDYEILYKSIVSSFKSFKFDRNSQVLINIFETKNLSKQSVLKSFVLAISACEYSFTKYFTKDKKENTVVINLLGEEDLKEALKESINIKDSLNLTRDLVNEPANVLTPEEFSKRCVEATKDLNIETFVYDEKWIEENNLHALYSVGKASVNKPKFIVMKYFGDKDSEKTLSLVGKGLTYDSGGYSIKSSDGMVTMKCDMGGAGAVLGAMTLIAKQNLKINVYGIIPTCENLINGNGFKPGDVINSLSGKTIEIISTDAEGRLVLADGVYYAADKLNTDMIIDIATLTGACGVALGTKYAAVVDNNKSIFDILEEGSKETVESIWRLPADPEYIELLKSDVADLKNLGGRYGGTITAGLFVGEFIKNKPWGHIDIAYVAWNDFPSKIFPKKGATGAGVELLYNFCKKISKK